MLALLYVLQPLREGEGATLQFAHPGKLRLTFLKFVVCNPCQSSPSSTTLVPLWFIIVSLVFFYQLSKVLFSGFLKLKGNFVRGQNN